MRVYLHSFSCCCQPKFCEILRKKFRKNSNLQQVKAIQGVLRCYLNTYDRRAFSIAGPTVCLTSSEKQRVVLTVLSSFLRQSCLVFTDVTSASDPLRWVFKRYALYKSTFYLLNYLLTKSSILVSIESAYATSY